MIQSVFLFATFVTGDWWLGNSRLSHRHFESMREIFVIRSQEFSLSPHVPRTSLHASSVVHTASALSAPTGHLPLEGKAYDTGETCYHEAFGHRHDLYSAALLIFMHRTTISHFSFLISHSIEAFIRNQGGRAAPQAKL